MRRSRWGTPGLLAAERGTNFESASWWTTYVTGGGTFGLKTQLGSQSTGQAWPYFGWDSNSGAGLGVRSFIHASGTPTNASTKAHSVHLRYIGPKPNTLASMTYGLGPATCVHAGSATLANCYYLKVYNATGAGRVDLYKHDNGVHALLTACAADVFPGDYVSLSYSHAGGTNSLEVFVNGVSVGTYSDVGGWSMASVSGKPGIYGHGSGVLIARTTEWWVTDGFQSVGELSPSYPGMTGPISVVIKRPQRYTDSSTGMRILVVNEIVQCRWGFSRIGGCNSATIRFRFGNGTSALQEASEQERLFVEPSVDDWNSAHWIGGRVEIHLRHDARDVASTGTELVWGGQASSIEYDSETREISVTADGLFSLMEKAVVRKELWKNRSVRDCILTVLDQVTQSASASGKDFRIGKNLSKIIAVGSLLDFKILEKEVKWETADSVLNDLFEFLPDAFVWGVDQYGDFYVDLPSSPYTTTLDQDLPVVFYDAGSAVKWSRELRWDNVTNQFEALGTEPDDASVERISATVACEKSRAMFGLRQQTESIDETKDAGILAKYAQAICKASASPEFSATLTVREQLAGPRTLWKSLSYVTPAVAVMDRVGLTDMAAAGGHPRPDYSMRLLGDTPGVWPDLNGTGGAQVRFACRSNEILNRSWLLHARLKFTTAHQGAAGDYAYILGRPSTSTGSNGWGALLWWKTTGKLYWHQDEGGVPVLHDSLITVDPTTPANQVVELTIFRDSTGSLKFYDAGVLKATIPAGGTMDTAAWDWCFWKYPGSFAGICAWDGAIEQFWFFDTAASGWAGTPIDSQPGGITAFLARNNGTNLCRQDGCGCLIHIKFHESQAEAADQGYYRMWLGSSTGASAGQATIVALGTSPADLTSGATHAASGHMFGQNHRWGGPLILQSDSVEYEYEGSTGTVEINYDLQNPRADAQRALARIKDQVARQNESLRRVAGTA